jgi:hypothetical protein
MIVVGKQCLNIRGKDTFILSGAFHYPRCPRPLWRDRLAKMKEAGLNCIDYYVPWNYHERAMPRDVDDFSQINLDELREFLCVVHDEFGFYSIARPGSYICAEWAGGGYPWWLLTKKPKDFPPDQQWLRSDDSTYLAWSRHWYDAVCPVIASEQLTRKSPDKGGVILFQIENEYDFFAGPTDEQRVNHLRALATDARRNGIDVPLMTCWTKQCRSNPDPVLKDVFDGPNMYPRWNMNAVEERLVAVKREQPDAPGMVPELQGGWFSGVGGVLSEDQEGLEPEQIHHLTLMAMMNDATILNYYMFFGGTNFGLWAGRNITATYDYNAPLREAGGVGERYLAVKAIGQILAEHGEAIAGSVTIDAKITGIDKEIPEGVAIRVREAKDGGLFFYFRNSTTADARCDTLIVHPDGRHFGIGQDLEPRGFELIHIPPGGQDITSAAHLTREHHRGFLRIERPVVPTGVRIATALCSRETASGEWRSGVVGRSLPEMGIYDARTVLYRAKRNFTREEIANFNTLWVDLFQDDNLVLQLNDRFIFPTGNYRGGPAFEIGDALREGENHFTLLYENKGHIHYGAGLEWAGGIRSILLTSRERLSVPILEWRAKLLQGGDENLLVDEDVDDSNWPAFTLDNVMADRLSADLQPGTETSQDYAARTLFRQKDKCVFRSTFTMSDADLRAGKTRLVSQNVQQSATVYLNGVRIGFKPNAPVKFEFDLSASLRAGRNTLAIVVENHVGFQAGLMKPLYLEGEEISGEALSLELLPELTGMRERWWDDSQWSSAAPVSLDQVTPLSRRGHVNSAPTQSPDALAKWYRMEFTLPEQRKDVFFPSRALIDASGNGVVYLNDHCIGRYWEAGPQREFYLPECWLHFGGRKNRLTLCLRSTQRGAALRAVEISPYAEQAEWRR